ncbi:MAG: DUF4160 domain-containing protein [Xanthomonadaceae bacterium]|jgi:hypothetical protein|nr:DUF4160 domain-containing protein [Xanthomonadaceae bacterium]
MPTVLRHGAFRLFFYSNEGAEPPHVHVECGESVAKYWLSPVQLAESRGFRSHELGRVRELVTQHRELLLERWHEFFGDPT